MKKILREILVSAVDQLRSDYLKDLRTIPPFSIDVPREEKHGDLSTNLALLLGSSLKINPRNLAERIKGLLNVNGKTFGKVEIAGPGFINFFFTPSFLEKNLGAILSEDFQYGQSRIGQGKKVQVEFVSANPTGPLHVGHGRGAAVGDTLANLLKAAGYPVEKEYYLNDRGNQMDKLGLSCWRRYQQLHGLNVEFPEDGYKGDYIWEIARDIIREKGDSFLNKNAEEVLPYFTSYTAETILQGIKKDLLNFGVTFDSWFSEKSLFLGEAKEKVFKLLEETGFLYKAEGALWFRSTLFNDEKDRVVIRSNGQETYFASDILYLKNKIERGFQEMVNVLGADHHGYIPRMKGIVKALGHDDNDLKIILVQLVNLIREGKQVSMSTRSGEFTDLAEVVQEVGKDVARYFFLMRRSDSHLDFDLDLAKKQSSENPVYYVQYAHARVCSLERMAAEAGMVLDSPGKMDLTPLVLPEELDLIKVLASYPDLIEESALALEPHRLTFYLQEVAGKFHAYYNHYRIIGEDQSLSQARLALAQGVKIVVRNALTLLGVNAPERM
ncbi:MAG: arginine--tRNA ligase [Candidatus Tectomicrobia bacterium]|uniref:Arginine--tRNA ligase n=1 Tax=Tectimicrobiota bacterium TaxID=2528274 RepID=A0A933GND6_UNCTE|nr:arginine--tRNA ligase [Candidatus Tectomicrobia bacterium]